MPEDAASRLPRTLSEPSAERTHGDSATRRLRRRWLRRPGRFKAALWIVVAWGLITNLARIGASPEAFDEPFYSQAAWRYIHGDNDLPPRGVFSNLDNFEHPPFAKYLFGLAQLVAGHPSVTADRVVAALCTIGAGVVLGVWLTDASHRWVGLGAGALVVVLPMSVPGFAFRFGRYGYLDPVAEFFAVGAMALAWWWFHRSGRAGWLLAVATGACLGLATACKENGFLGAVGPILVGLLLVARSRRTLVERLLQTCAAVAAAVAVFAAAYLGLGHPAGAFRFMLRQLHEHGTFGHRVLFAGRSTQHPPWWALLWFAQHGLGGFVAALCLICVVAAVALRHDQVVLWCLASLAGPLLFHTLISPIVLSFYWVMWMPAFLALVALGGGALVQTSSWHIRSGPRLVRGAAGFVCVVGVIGASAHDTYRTLTQRFPAPGPHRNLAYADAVLAHDPLVYLRLGERSGTVAADATSRHRDGSYVGHPTLSAAGLLASDPNTAAEFDRPDQYASLAGASWMDSTNYTIALWFRTTATGEYLVSRDDYQHAKVWDVLLDAEGRVRFLTFHPGDGAGQVVVSPKRYNDGRRHMVMATKSGTTLRLYVDGRQVAMAGYARFTRPPALPLEIDLARRGNAIGGFRGTLDEFAFYGKALSHTDAGSLFLLGAEHASG